MPLIIRGKDLETAMIYRGKPLKYNRIPEGESGHKNSEIESEIVSEREREREREWGERERERERERLRERDRQTDRQTDRVADREVIIYEGKQLHD